MSRFVAFLRAVNVGKRRVSMARLRDELEGLGFSDVSTFINSGNAIFTSIGAAAKLEPKIEARLAEAFGFEIPTLLRTAKEVAKIVEREPFGDIGPHATHMVALLRAAPSAKAKAAIEALSNDIDRLEVHGREVHWLIDGKVSGTSLRAKDWTAFGGAVSTTRNMTMLVKLAAKLDG
jgi:uncharacterized protein (DUF1697 family)